MRSTTTACSPRRTWTRRSSRSAGTSTPARASTPSGRRRCTSACSDDEYVGKLLNNLGQLHAITGRPDEAVPLLRESFRIAVEQDNRIDAAFAASSLASARLHSGDPEGAIQREIAQSSYWAIARNTDKKKGTLGSSWARPI